MPIFLLVLASIFALTAINGTVGDMMEQAKKDLFGAGNQDYGFIVWAGAIILVAALLRAVDLPTAGRTFVVLVILVFLLSHGDILNSLMDQLKSVSESVPGPAPPPGPLGASVIEKAPKEEKAGKAAGAIVPRIRGGLSGMPVPMEQVDTLFGSQFDPGQIDYSGLGNMQ